MTETRHKTTSARSFGQFVAEEFSTAEERQGLVSDVETTIAVAHLMGMLEQIRAKRELSKAQIARRMNRHAPAIARLLSGDQANPTVRTLIELLQAMGLRATLVIEPAAAPRSRRKESRPSPKFGNVLSIKARIPARATA